MEYKKEGTPSLTSGQSSRLSSDIARSWKSDDSTLVGSLQDSKPLPRLPNETHSANLSLSPSSEKVVLSRFSPTMTRCLEEQANREKELLTANEKKRWQRIQKEIQEVEQEVGKPVFLRSPRIEALRQQIEQLTPNSEVNGEQFFPQLDNLKYEYKVALRNMLKCEGILTSLAANDQDMKAFVAAISKRDQEGQKAILANISAILQEMFPPTEKQKNCIFCKSESAIATLRREKDSNAYAAQQNMDKLNEVNNQLQQTKNELSKIKSKFEEGQHQWKAFYKNAQKTTAESARLSGEMEVFIKVVDLVMKHLNKKNFQPGEYDEMVQAINPLKQNNQKLAHFLQQFLNALKAHIHDKNTKISSNTAEEEKDETPAVLRSLEDKQNLSKSSDFENIAKREKNQIEDELVTLRKINDKLIQENNDLHRVKENLMGMVLSYAKNAEPRRQVANDIATNLMNGENHMQALSRLVEDAENQYSNSEEKLNFTYDVMVSMGLNQWKRDREFLAQKQEIAKIKAELDEVNEDKRRMVRNDVEAVMGKLEEYGLVNDLNPTEKKMAAKTLIKVFDLVDPAKKENSNNNLSLALKEVAEEQGKCRGHNGGYVRAMWPWIRKEMLSWPPNNQGSSISWGKLSVSWKANTSLSKKEYISKCADAIIDSLLQETRNKTVDEITQFLRDLALPPVSASEASLTRSYKDCYSNSSGQSSDESVKGHSQPRNIPNAPSQNSDNPYIV